jgi:hypothetical protein
MRITGSRPVGVLVSTRYRPQAYPWEDGYQPVNLGTSGGPRVSAIGEVEANVPRTWPVPYAWRLMGLGAMPLFQLGPTVPTFNNQIAPAQYGYNWMMPGINRNPTGG